MIHGPMIHGYIIDGFDNFDRVRNLTHTGDGFYWATASTGETLRLAPSEVFPTAYAVGLAVGCRPGMHVWNDVYDFAAAACSWKTAQDNHADTSFYSARRIRDYRAYWLGRLRVAREVLSERRDAFAH